MLIKKTENRMFQKFLTVMTILDNINKCAVFVVFFIMIKANRQHGLQTVSSLPTNRTLYIKSWLKLVGCASLKGET